MAAAGGKKRDAIGLNRHRAFVDHTPKHDEIGSNRHRALAYCLSMIFSENRFALFRIML
ncbi:MAG: hypothetical protein ACI4XG_15710 [Bradyrhizobium sp.]